MEIFSIVLTKEQYGLINKKNLFSNPQWSNDGKLVWVIPAVLMTVDDLAKLFPELHQSMSADVELVAKIEPRKFRNIGGNNGRAE